jgi:putative peptidoglycan lipid II flippase
MIVNIVFNLIALAALPPREVVAGLGIGFGLANLAGAIVAGRILSVRLHGLDGAAVTQSLVRMHVATIPAAVFAFGVAIMMGSVLSHGDFGALATVVVGGGGALLLYFLFARALHVRELTEVLSSLTSRFRR